MGMPAAEALRVRSVVFPPLDMKKILKFGTKYYNIYTIHIPVRQIFLWWCLTVLNSRSGVLQNLMLLHVILEFLFRARRIPVYTSHPVPSRSILTLPSHLRLCLPRSPFPSGFLHKNLYAFIVSLMRATNPPLSSTQLPNVLHNKLNISGRSTYTPTVRNTIPNSLQISHFIQNHLL